MVGDGWYELLEKRWGDGFEERAEEQGIYGNNWYYWTRSPYSDYGTFVRRVGSEGAFDNFYLDFSAAIRSNYGVRPALNLKSEILVSEINP